MKTVLVGNRREWLCPEKKTYRDAEEFLEDFRSDGLPEGFTLSTEAFAEMAERMNGGDTKLAEELCGSGILALMKAVKGSGVEGLLSLAEACKEG